MDKLNKKKSEKLKKKRMKKIEKIILGIGLTSVIFIVATYAWFIGLTQVNVNEFEINVKSSDGLTISLDANTFTTSVDISKEAVTTDLTEYTSNTNAWVSTDGLSPISSVGLIDTTTSKLKLYSKTSITSINGGYKLRTSLIDNSTTENGDYVAFDLFIKNTSGTGYTSTFNYLDDEGVYMSKDSSVGLTEVGTGGDGIQNSLRVAFMQIGRIKYNIADAKTKAQGITCTTTDDVTGLCNQGTNDSVDDGRGITWNIWEPNEKAHTTDSISHFSKVCKKRTDANTYEGACDAIADDTYTDTYAIAGEITSSDNVNIYDGLNTYETLVNMEKFTYFTDSDIADEEGKELFYLAPNSITKVRVYIWLEGQDVDNYDLGTIGKKITVSFGFTKDKYSASNNEDDENEEETPAEEENNEEPGGGE